MKELSKNKVLNNGCITLYDCSDSIESLRKAMEFVGTISSISRGKTYVGEEAIKLCKKLLKWRHLSPFEFVRIPIKYSITFPVKAGVQESWRNNFFGYLFIWNSFTERDKERLKEVHKNNVALFKLKVPIFIGRQIMRHRSFSFMEKSGRHKLLETDFHLPEDNLKEKIKEEYNNLASKFPLEKARSILPLGLYTEFYVIGDVFAYANFFLQRLNKETQEETRKCATIMLKMIRKSKPEMYVFIVNEMKKLRKNIDLVSKMILGII